MPRRTRKNIQIVPGGTFGGSSRTQPDLSGFVDALTIFKNDQERKRLEGLSEAERRAAISQVGEFGLDLDRDISAKAAESALAQFISGQVAADQSSAIAEANLTRNRGIATDQQQSFNELDKFVQQIIGKSAQPAPIAQPGLPAFTEQQNVQPLIPGEVGDQRPVLDQDQNILRQIVPSAITQETADIGLRAPVKTRLEGFEKAVTTIDPEIASQAVQTEQFKTLMTFMRGELSAQDKELRAAGAKQNVPKTATIVGRPGDKDPKSGKDLEGKKTLIAYDPRDPSKAIVVGETPDNKLIVDLGGLQKGTRRALEIELQGLEQSAARLTKIAAGFDKRYFHTRGRIQAGFQSFKAKDPFFEKTFGFLGLGTELDDDGKSFMQRRRSFDTAVRIEFFKWRKLMTGLAGPTAEMDRMLDTHLSVEDNNAPAFQAKMEALAELTRDSATQIRTALEQDSIPFSGDVPFNLTNINPNKVAPSRSAVRDLLKQTIKDFGGVPKISE